MPSWVILSEGSEHSRQRLVLRCKSCADFLGGAHMAQFATVCVPTAYIARGAMYAPPGEPMRKEYQACDSRLISNPLH